MNKICNLFLGPFCSQHCPIDFTCTETSPRGLSGSDLILCESAKAFRDKGYQVNIFTTLLPGQPEVWEGCNLYHYNRKYEIITKDHEFALTISEPEMLRGLPSEVITIHSHQLNGFDYCPGDWQELSDIKTSPSNGHLSFHKRWIAPEKLADWHVVHDATDPEQYKASNKIPGKMIWISSPDRGLHWLLSMYPAIKKQIPELSLDIYYKMDSTSYEDMEPRTHPSKHPHIWELAKRAVYIKEMLTRLKPFGVNFLGSVSRQTVRKALSEAQVLAFPCSTVRFTEGYSISVEEACSCECAPVICGEDCLGELYQEVCTVIPAPVQHHQQEFVDAVVRTFKDKEYRDMINKKARAFAEENSWKNVTDQLVNLVHNNSKYKVK